MIYILIVIKLFVKTLDGLESTRWSNTHQMISWNERLEVLMITTNIIRQIKKYNKAYLHVESKGLTTINIQFNFIDDHAKMNA